METLRQCPSRASIGEARRQSGGSDHTCGTRRLGSQAGVAVGLVAPHSRSAQKNRALCSTLQATSNATSHSRILGLQGRGEGALCGDSSVLKCALEVQALQERQDRLYRCHRPFVRQADCVRHTDIPDNLTVTLQPTRLVWVIVGSLSLTCAVKLMHSR